MLARVMNPTAYLFLEDVRLCKSMHADGFLSDFDFLDNKVEAGMG